MSRCAVLLCIALCVSAVDGRYRSLMVEVTEDGADVVMAKIDTSASPLRRQQRNYPPKKRVFEGRDSNIHVFYHDLESAQKLGTEPRHMLSFKDARRFHAHGWDSVEEKFESGIEEHTHAVVDFAVPEHVEEVTLDDQTLKKTFRVSIPSHAEVATGKFLRHSRATLSREGTVQEAVDYEVITSTVSASGVRQELPVSGPPETQQNFVFVSGGYMKHEKDKFLGHLEHVVNILQTACSECSNAVHLTNTVPFKRYFSTFNVYAVWQESRASGASVPSRALTVDNNLGCSYGTVVHRALFCSPSLVIALADVAPCGAANKENVVAIVLVNSEDYGGAASYRPTVRVGSFSASHFNLDDASEKGVFSSLFFHEVGHCYSDLMDEYDTGLTESSEIPYANCAFTSDKGKQQWSTWYNYPVSTVESGLRDYYTLGQPEPVCGWSNYYKPSSSCFMEKLTTNGKVPRLCPVCREKTVSQFYRTGMDIANPKCPLEAEILVIDATTPVYIFINSLIANMQAQRVGGPIAVAWSCIPRGSSPGSPGTNLVSDAEDKGYIQMTAEQFAICKGDMNTPIDVSVTLSDKTLWVPEGSTYRGDTMIQTSTWEVRLVPDASAKSVGANSSDCLNDGVFPSTVHPSKLVSTPGLVTKYYSICREGMNCNATYSKPREYNASLAEAGSTAVDDVESLIIGIPGLLSLLGVIGFLVFWLCLARRCSYARAKSVYETTHDKMVSIVRKVIVISGIFFILVACACMAVGLVWYNEVGAFLKLVLIAAFILCVCLFFMAFVGTVSAYYRAKVLLYVNTFGLFCSLAVMVYATHVVRYVGDHITDGGCEVDSSATPSPTQAATLANPPCALDDTDIAICGIENVGCELRELWKTLNKNYPDKICAFQSELKCSGYTQPCNKGQSTDFCPIGCDAVNAEYGDACKVKLQDDIETQCKKLFPFMVILTIAMAIAMFNNLALACLLSRQHKAQMKTQRASLATYTESMRHRQGDVKMRGTQNRAMRLMRALSQDQRNKMQERFKAADRDRNGTLDQREMRMFLRAVLCKDLTAKELDEVFKTADSNSDGNIDFKEFCAVFKTDSQDEYNPNERSDRFEMTERSEPSFANQTAAGSKDGGYSRFTDNVGSNPPTPAPVPLTPATGNLPSRTPSPTPPPKRGKQKPGLLML